MSSHTLHHSATYFFTLRLAQRHDDLLLREIAELRRAMRATLRRYPFAIDAISVLPDTIHTIWTLPLGDSAIAPRIGMLKGRFSRAMPMPAQRTLAQIKKAEKGIWQRHHWEHQITDPQDYARHRDMIYRAPVQAGLCATPQAWTHTSLHRDLAGGGAAPRWFGSKGGSATTPQVSDQHLDTAPKSTDIAGLKLLQ